MSGETGEVQSGWTVDTLHSHVWGLLEAQRSHFQAVIDERDRRYDRRMDDAERAVAAALRAAEKASEKADTATEKRFDSTNEFRGQLNDQAATLFPRAEAETRFASLAERLDALDKVSNEKITIMAARLDRGEGKGVGLKDGWGYMLGAVGFLTGIVGIVAAIVK